MLHYVTEWTANRGSGCTVLGKMIFYMEHYGKSHMKFCFTIKEHDCGSKLINMG